MFYRAGQLQPKVRIRNFISKMACPEFVLEPPTEAEHDDMVALIQRAHHHGQLGLQLPSAKKKQNRAASPTPAATTAEKATRRRDELGYRAHEIYYASDLEKAQYFAETANAWSWSGILSGSRNSLSRGRFLACQGPTPQAKWPLGAPR